MDIKFNYKIQNVNMDHIPHGLKSHFLNLYSIALSDTQVEVKELEFLYRFGQDRGVSKDELDEIILHPDKISFQIPEDVFRKIEYLYDFAKMILADGIVDEFEITSLKKFCIKFGFKRDNIERLCEFLIDEAKHDTPLDELLKVVKQNL